MHKTGSTSIQYSLATLDNATHLYAGIRRSSNHGLHIWTAFADRPERHPKVRRLGLDERTVQDHARQIRYDLESAIQLAQGRTLLISEEGLTGLGRDAVERFKDFFDTHSVDAEIAAYVREPAGYISSAFQQRVKAGKLRRFVPDKLFPAYRSQLEKFDKVFGRGKVHLWKFDPERFPQGSVVRDFCLRTGIDFKHVREVRKNESITRELSAILYSYGQWARKKDGLLPSGKEAAALAAMLRDLPATKFRLAPSVVRPVLDANREDIEWIESRLGEPFVENLGEDRESDVFAETDLLKPVPGALKLLAKALRDAGHHIADDVGDDINPLIEAFLRTRARPSPEWLSE